MHTYYVEFTDTFGGEANYAWVKRAVIHMPELTNYGYDGATNYAKANRAFERELVRKAKRAIGFKARHTKESYGDGVTLRFPGLNQIMFITYAHES